MTYISRWFALLCLACGSIGCWVDAGGLGGVSQGEALNETRLQTYDLQIVSLWVSHGDATLIFLPNGEVALVDTGQDFALRDYVLPFLERHGIQALDYLILTHYDGDHASGRIDVDGRVYLGSRWDSTARRVPVRTVWDYNTFRAGDHGNWGGVELLVLNSAHENPSGGENQKSLSLHLSYNGFAYALGGDIYREQQERILRDFPETFPVHVYRTNHHMHGSVSREYLVRSNPYLFITSAEEAVYQRSAYVDDLASAITELHETSDRHVESLLTLEHGNIVVAASGGGDWTYATFAHDARIGGLGAHRGRPPEPVTEVVEAQPEHDEGEAPKEDPPETERPELVEHPPSYPVCTKPALAEPMFGYRYMPFDSEWGYMAHDYGAGVSCRRDENVSGTAYPVCHTACPEQAQEDVDWGWCANLGGFSCTEP